MNKATVYKDLDEQWRWNIKASNGEIIADSAEGYRNRADALAGLALTQDLDFEVVSED